MPRRIRRRSSVGQVMGQPTSTRQALLLAPKLPQTHATAPTAGSPARSVAMDSMRLIFAGISAKKDIAVSARALSQTHSHFVELAVEFSASLVDAGNPAWLDMVRKTEQTPHQKLHPWPGHRIASLKWRHRLGIVACPR